MIVPREDVQSFLDDFSPVAAAGEVVYEGNREENRRFRKEHGLTKALIQEFLSELEVEEYSKGPVPHKTRPQRSVWFFGPDYCGTPLYVKLADWRPKHPYFHCISFKEARPPLPLPYRT